MTPQDAARILAPIRIGFLAARLRLQEQKAEAEQKTGITAWRALSDLQEAEEFLIAREAQWDFAGMLSAVYQGDRACMWPNVIPDPEAMAAALDAWTEGKPDMRAKVEALQAPPALVVIRRLTVRHAVGE